jgi:radical SAM protein with 4Fe4S-binding SPASM domain
MPVDDFATILRNIDITLMKGLRLFNYGEPLLHPNLPDILLKIPNQTYRIQTVGISTNGQHHDFAMLEEVFRVRVLNLIIVSCDGDGTREEYERLRPPGKYEKLIEFLTKTKELRDRYSPETGLYTSTVTETREAEKKWLDLLTPMGWIPVFRPWAVLPQSMKSQAEQKRLVLKKGCKLFRKKYLYVDSDGTVVPCCSHPRAFELGNLKEKKFSEIVNGKLRKLMLKELNTNKHNMAVCGKCPN